MYSNFDTIFSNNAPEGAFDALFDPPGKAMLTRDAKPKAQDAFDEFLDGFDIPEEKFLSDMDFAVPEWTGLNDSFGAPEAFQAQQPAPAQQPQAPLAKAASRGSLPDFARAFMGDVEDYKPAGPSDFLVPQAPSSSADEASDAFDVVPEAEVPVAAPAPRVAPAPQAPRAASFAQHAAPLPTGADAPSVPLSMGQLPMRLDFMSDDQIEARTSALERYRAKKANRCFNKKIRYQSRKAYADVRPRYKGRFVSKEEYDQLVAQDAARAALAARNGGAKNGVAKGARRSKRAE
ncbi:unnamed protein product [Pedinophyceae sp. YPF-701]|nr:unnamed protein product [Pedinophyceae sp. YPF-701]